MRVKLTGRDKFQPVTTGCAIAWTLNKLYPDQWSGKELVKMLQNDKAAVEVLALDDPTKARSLWADDLRKWIVLRDKYLIYRD